MLTAEQQELRRTGLGGSDMAAILGLDRYRQPIHVFYQKRPDLAAEHGVLMPAAEGNAIDFGNYVEEPIAKLYEKVTGRKVRKSNKLHTHTEHEILRGYIDRKVEGERRGLEIKSANWTVAKHWGKSGTDEVAEYYLPQVHQYMLVLDYPVWDVAALIGGSTDFRIYTVERDPEWDSIITDAALSFWHNHVLPGIPPEINLDHRSARDALRMVNHLINDEDIDLPDSAEHWHQVLEEASKQAKQYKAIADGAKLHIEHLMGNAGKARINGIKGAYVRKKIKRDAYQVEASEYITTSYSSRVK